MTSLPLRRLLRLPLAVGSALVLLCVSGCGSLALFEPSYSTVPPPPRLSPDAPPEVQKPSYFPDKPLTLLVGFSRGGEGDVAARAMTPRLERALNQPVVVVNRSSAQDAWAQLKVAKPDGYTMAMIQSPQLQIATLDSLGKALFSLEDFVPIVGQLQDPQVLFVRSLSPFKSVAELVAAAKAQPDGISAGVMGGGVDNLALAEFQRRVGVKLRVTRYPDPISARMSTINGQVELHFGSLSSLASTVRAGQGRLLAILDERRSPDFPDVPTMRESGADVVVLSTTGYAFPKGTSAELQDYLAWSLYVAISDPSHQSKMKEAGHTVHFMAPAAFRKLISNEAARAKELQTGLR
ncbi:MAG TPA: tripartite tricarboxylate transporter substrate binding protein [Chloroflexota bacterium]|nr:tripartite tricarboxylate transporter substrate binding protein [Chloroflexota bacterium]